MFNEMMPMSLGGGGSNIVMGTITVKSGTTASTAYDTFVPLDFKPDHIVWGSCVSMSNSCHYYYDSSQGEKFYGNQGAYSFGTGLNIGSTQGYAGLRSIAQSAPYGFTVEGSAAGYGGDVTDGYRYFAWKD